MDLREKPGKKYTMEILIKKAEWIYYYKTRWTSEQGMLVKIKKGQFHNDKMII